MSKKRTYICIDLKSFYASSECVDRGLDPLTTNLVVADLSRTEKTICLAVSPSLKGYGISGRARLFEVITQVKRVNEARLQKAIRMKKVAKDENGKYAFAGSSFDDLAIQADPSLELSYIIAPPHMARYMEVSAQIYSIYLKFVSPEDILAYSIDEVFMDITGYLNTYGMTAQELVKTMIREVLYATGITATAGIGTNLYLAKIAMDIVAKKMPADKDGVRMAELDEESYRYLLWDHTPLTDFWRIGSGTARRLASRNIKTMGELARMSTYDEEWFYKTFGVDAEILIDHAWGLEPCTMKDIKVYKPSTTSISEGQVLSSPYDYEKAKLIIKEMADSIVMQLVDRHMATDSITIDVGYDRENVDRGDYIGAVCTDHYGRMVPKPAHGSIKLQAATNLGSKILPAVTELFDRIADNKLLVRRLTICAGRLTPDDGCQQIDMFTDVEAEEREKKLQDAVISIKKRYGKNAILRGISYEESATMRDRNGYIGGHKA